MKRRATQDLFEYWDALRGSRPAPARNDIDPGAIRSCLPHTFVLSFAPGHGYPFQIAGTSVCAMFGAELSRTRFDRLWAADQQERVRDLIAAVIADLEPATVSVIGHNPDGETIDLDMVALPLSVADGPPRILGAFAAVTRPYWLGTRPLTTLTIDEITRPGVVEHEASDRCAANYFGQPWISRIFHG
ncbi:PAS domain-containing protein [Pseudorhodoplanes sp.]|jgi:hypothetical protein|uniref:PAS domain-containing protein n=1 Tax=Pseudorhodoplanes sp. TaxID=1934341 RepID=UPI002B9D580F|nr:PAS domain-containing protein [Pseudorhodoplanes sp.]HWV40702.1 PAS domain-containing protein [Pseudorhodoplanes sp.]